MDENPKSRALRKRKYLRKGRGKNASYHHSNGWGSKYTGINMTLRMRCGHRKPIKRKRKKQRDLISRRNLNELTQPKKCYAGDFKSICGDKRGMEYN